MSDKANLDKQFSVSERKSIIAKYPLFSLLNADDIHQLAALTEEVFVDSGEVITHEGDIVDFAYLIASGTAEVTRAISTVEKTQIMHIANLSTGDAVGLADTGFYSRSGIRTATVRATSPMRLLALDLKDLHFFLNNPGVTYPALKTVGEKIILMNFLKQTAMFQHIANHKIKHFADHVKRIALIKDDLLFKEGDIADKSYFLLNGQMRLTSNNNHQNAPAKTVEALSLLGEDGLLNKGKHTFTASAATNCELFMIDNNDANKFIKRSHIKNDSRASSFLSLFIKRIRDLWK